MDQNNSKYTVSFGLSVALCAVLNAFLVIAKESCKDVANWMQKATGHHWITHVAIVVVLFTLLGWIFARMNNGQGPKMSLHRSSNIILAGVVAGMVIILGFYVVGG
jgi:hypothetical protein